MTYEDNTLVTADFKSKLTGGSSAYYQVRIEHPTSGGAAYSAECNDIIEALGMTFAEGNVFKAIWRMAAARRGNGKQGNTLLYDAEKVAWFGKRLVALNTPFNENNVN